MGSGAITTTAAGERLFLGGPWHGRREKVVVDSSVWVVPKLPSSSIGALFEEPETVVYTSRRTPTGERVFVAPGYSYDTPEWLAFDTEAWVAAIFPAASGWEHLGPWRWRGRSDEPSYRRSWRYLLGDDRGEAYVSVAVPRDFCGEVPHDVVFRDLQHELDYQRLPQCVVPDCPEKGRSVFTAAERGRLAGRDWKPGDEIRICPKHAYDVYRAQYVYGLDDLAEWLQPDAKLDPLDAFDAEMDSLYGREIDRSRRRMLRVDGAGLKVGS